MAKLSDEQIAEWYSEWEGLTTAEPRPGMITSRAYIARKAYAAGLERAAKRCKSVADCYGDNANSPNLGVTGKKAMLHKQAAAMDCYNAIRDASMSEGKDNG